MPVLAIVLSAAAPATGQAFVHPGILHTSADLERMRARVAARIEPYLAGWNRMRTDSHTSLTYSPRPYAAVQRIPDTASYDALVNDAIAAHTHAIGWVITGDEAYATKAVEILNAWSATLTSFPSTGDPILASGLTGYQLAAASEVMRATYPAWPAMDQARMRTLLLNVFYPPNHNFLVYHEPDGLVHSNTGVNQHFFASWDAIAMTTVAAVAIFADDRDKYTEAVNYFKNGTGNAAIMRAVFDGATGQLQESGRDPEHAQLGIGLLATFCEMAWNQGDDLYGYADNRLLKGFEYTASYLEGNDVPFAPYSDPFRSYTMISQEATAQQITQARNNPRPIYEMVWNHYENRRGIPAPFTKQVAQRIRPEGFRADHTGFGTILFTRELSATGGMGGGGAGGVSGSSGVSGDAGGTAGTGALGGAGGNGESGGAAGASGTETAGGVGGTSGDSGAGGAQSTSGGQGTAGSPTPMTGGVGAAPSGGAGAQGGSAGSIPSSGGTSSGATGGSGGSSTSGSGAVTPSSTTAEGPGCGCRTSSERTRGDWLVVAAALGAALLRRRTRRVC